MFDLVPWRRKTREYLPVNLRTFDEDFDGMVKRFFGGDSLLSSTALGRDFSPSMDILETDDALPVSAEIPGVDPEKLDVNITNGVLTIKGEKQAEKVDKSENHHRVERSFGSFSRSFRLPCEVDTAKSDAVFKNGLLKVTIPKAAEAKKASTKIEAQ